MKRGNREGSIRLRGHTYHIQWREDGRLKSESTHSDNYDDAVNLLQRRLGAIAEGRSTGRDGSRLTLAQLKEMLHQDYVQHDRKTWRNIACSFDKMIEVFGENARVPQVTSNRLAQYLSDRLTEGAMRSTVQKEFAALKRSLNIAVERGLLPYRVTFPKIGKIENARLEFIEEYEWALIRPELPEWWQDMGDMALGMGWRTSGEIRPLTWDRVDWDRGLVFLKKYTTKNKDGRAFPFAQDPAVEAALKRRRAYTDDVEQRTGKQVPWVFHVEGHKITESTSFYRPWHRACKAAKVTGADGKDKRPHDFRRSAVRTFETQGVPRSIAKRLVGHRTDDMYARYSITTTDDLRDAVRKLHAPAEKKDEKEPWQQ